MRPEARGKTAAFLIGTVTFLALLEMSLRLLGAAQRAGPQLPQRRPGDTVILCLGDSYTYGTGAPRDKSYPRQLEELLNKTGGGKRFVVVNAGVPGHNTAQILEDLEANLAAVRPDLVILLAGMANFWNLKGYHARLSGDTWGAAVLDGLYRVRVFKLAVLLALDLRRASQNAVAGPAQHLLADAPNPGGQSFHRCLGLVLERLRSMPWAVWAYQRGAESNRGPARDANLAELERIRAAARRPGLRREISLFFAKTGHETGEVRTPEPSRRPRAWAQVLNRLLRIRAFAPGRLAGPIRGALNAAPAGQADALAGVPWGRQEKMRQAIVLVQECMELRDQGDFTEAARRCRKAVEIHPESKNAHCCLGLSLKHAGRSREAARAFMRGIEADPGARDRLDYTSYGELVAIYFASQDPEARREIAEFLEKAAAGPGGALARKMLTMIRVDDASYQEDISSWIAEELGKIIALCRDSGARVLMQSYPGGQDPMNRAAAERHSVPFVDHSAVFSPLVSGGRRAEYFVPDGHCNARGNGLVAENLRRKMSELGLLDGRRTP